MNFAFELEGKGYRDLSFAQSLTYAEELGLWDEEIIDYKDHGNPGGFMVYYGEESIRLSELL